MLVYFDTTEVDQLHSSVEKHCRQGAGPVFLMHVKGKLDKIFLSKLATNYSFNGENVKLFFSKLADVMDPDKLGPEQNWNVDETGISTVQKPRNVVETKALKVTMCAAVGYLVPPMFIFPRQNLFVMAPQAALV